MSKSSNKNAKRVENRKKPVRYIVCRELRPEVFPLHIDLVVAFQQRDAQRRDQTQELQTVVLPFDVSLSSDSSGNIQQVYANDPTNSSYWNTYRQNFDQYRVLGMRFSYEPHIITGGSTVTTRAPISIVTDYDDSTGLTAYSLAETYSDHQRFVSDRKFTKVGSEAANIDGWNDVMTTSPVNQFWMKTFSSGNTFSTIMGRVMLEYVVQFRGRGI